MKKEMILVLDFGGQYNQLIARRVRECNVYAEVHPYTISLEEIKDILGFTSSVEKVIMGKQESLQPARFFFGGTYRRFGYFIDRRHEALMKTRAV